jgi:hypothetical protein
MHPTSRPQTRPICGRLRPGRSISSSLVTCALALAACENRTPLSGLQPDEMAALLADGDLASSPLSLTAPAAPVPAPPPIPVPPPVTDPAGTGGSGGGGGVADGGAAIDVAPSDGGSCFPPVPDPGMKPPRPVPPGALPPGALPPGRGCRIGPLARWDLDDCSTIRTDLRDSSGGFSAFRTVGAACVPGVEGQGVSLPRATDLLYAPDQPQFTFDGGVTVATWLKPDNLGGQRTIFRKREGLTSSVALMTVGKNFVFIINRDMGKPALVSAPAPEGRWVHVAATYDGETLRLYVDGVEAASQQAKGRIAGGEGPLLFGNDIFQRRFEGTIDKIWFDTQAADPTTIASLLCLHQPPLLTVSPARSAPAVPGQTVQFEASLTNQNTAVCPADSFFLQAFGNVQGFQVQPSFSFFAVESGQTVKTPINVTSPDDAEGEVEITFSAFNNSTGTSAQASATYVVSDVGCRVRTSRELMIKDLSVVEDPVRTGFTADAGDARRGIWTFKHLVEQLAPSPEEAPAMVERILGTFNETQSINGFLVQPRPGMKATILDPWPRKDGKLDLERAPLRLLAIVNRIDLRHLGLGNAGEGRFVFGFLDPFGFPLEATLILEYALPASTEADVHAWADGWHALGALPFPSEAYNSALGELTARFTGRGVFPARPGENALNTLRTNEIALGNNGLWELREFTMDGTGILRPDTIKLTPDRPSFDRSAELAAFINANEEAIVKEEHDVPALLNGKAFLAGSVFNDLSSWDAPGIINPEARHKFALNTCNGCHSAQEAGVAFLQISNRFPGQEAGLSGFLTGTVVFDRTRPEGRVLNDLARRNHDLRFLACPADQIPEIPPPPPLPTPDGGGGGPGGGKGGSSGGGAGGATGGGSGPIGPSPTPTPVDPAGPGAGPGVGTPASAPARVITPRQPTVRDGIFRVH